MYFSYRLKKENGNFNEIRRLLRSCISNITQIITLKTRLLLLFFNSIKIAWPQAKVITYAEKPKKDVNSVFASENEAYKTVYTGGK